MVHHKDTLNGRGGGVGRSLKAANGRFDGARGLVAKPQKYLILYVGCYLP